MRELINERLIELSLDSDSKEEVIKNLADLICQDGRIDDCEGYIREVLNREKLSSTGIGFGIAIPHGKCQTVNTPTVAFGRLNRPIDWKSLDDQPVQVVFLLAVPEASATNEHLKILAALSRKLMDDDFRMELLSAADKEILVDLLESIFANAIA